MASRVGEQLNTPNRPKRGQEEVSPSPTEQSVPLKSQKSFNKFTASTPVTTESTMEACNEDSRQKSADAIKQTIHLRTNEALSLALADLKSKKGDDVSSLITVIPAIISPLVEAISNSVEEAVSRALEQMDRRMAEREQAAGGPVLQRMQASLRCLTYENDALQQYSRRESVRILGIKQVNGETPQEIETKTLAVLNRTGVNIKPEDVAACHEVGKPKDGKRAIIVRFVSRKKRAELMKAKKELNNINDMKGIFVNDDLTPLRARLLGYIKELDQVARAWTVDGRIYAAKKCPVGLPDDQRPPPVRVENPDDLFKLGEDNINFERLGLNHLEF